MNQNKVAVIGAMLPALCRHIRQLFMEPRFFYLREMTVLAKILISGKGRCNLTNIKDIIVYTKHSAMASFI